MKKLILVCIALGSGYFASAQDITLTNNTAYSKRIRIIALSGSTEYPSPEFNLGANATISDDVSDYYLNTWSTTIPSNAYVHLVIVGAPCGTYSVGTANPTGNACAGTPEKSNGIYNLDGITRDATVVINP